MKLFNLFIFIAFTLSFVSCGKLVQRKSDVIEPAFVEYVQQFYELCGETNYEYNCENSYIPVSFGHESEFGQEEAAYCDHVTKEIRIRQSTWIQNNTHEKAILIFHELAHCVLGKGHDNTKVKSLPVSLMNSYSVKVQDHTYFLMNIYVTQLFFGTSNSFAVEKMQYFIQKFTAETVSLGVNPDYRAINSERVLIVDQVDFFTLNIYDYNLEKQELTKTLYYKDQKTVETHSFDKKDIILDKQNLRIFAPYYNEEI